MTGDPYSIHSHLTCRCSRLPCRSVDGQGCSKCDSTCIHCMKTAHPHTLAGLQCGKTYLSQNYLQIFR